MSAKQKVDLFVIGAGSGGVRAARIAASYGAKVAIADTQFEHGPPGFTAMGGTCVNVGCVPKKLFSYGAQYGRDMRDASGFGWSTGGSPSHDWASMVAAKDVEISRLNGVYERMLRGAGVDLIAGRATLRDPRTVTIEGTDESFECDNVLIAVGGWPWMPSIPGIEHAITSNEAFYLPELPRRVAVVGGGYIAVEFAGIFHGLGAEVTQIHRGDALLRGFDGDCQRHLAREMQHAGVALRLGESPTRIEKSSSSLVVHTDAVTAGESAKAGVECDAVLFATGRRPKTEGLGLDAAGVASNVDGDGSIIVDEWSRTTAPGGTVFAVGDVTNRMNLTPIALEEGHCVADTLFGGKPRVCNYENVPTAVFSSPPLGTVGLTEEECVARFERTGAKAVVFESEYGPMRHTMSGRGARSFMKMLVDEESDAVLGIHVVDADAAEMIQGFAVAMKAGATKAQFDGTVGVHPSSAEELVTMRTPARVIGE